MSYFKDKFIALTFPVFNSLRNCFCSNKDKYYGLAFAIIHHKHTKLGDYDVNNKFTSRHKSVFV